jgi:hypothetical protein
MSSRETAERLRVTQPTVRELLRRGELSGEKRPRGTRFVWVIDSASVESCAKLRSTTARTRRTSVAELRDRLAHLESTVEALTYYRDSPSSKDTATRTHGVTQTLNLRAILAAQMHADEARAKVIDHLLRALTAGEEADMRRREALTAAQTLLGESLLPDNASEVIEPLSDNRRRSPVG